MCSVKRWKRFEYMYKWVHSCFTKFNAYQLTSYDRILLLDADMMALSSLDDLFKGDYV